MFNPFFAPLTESQERAENGRRMIRNKVVRRHRRISWVLRDVVGDDNRNARSTWGESRSANLKRFKCDKVILWIG